MNYGAGVAAGPIFGAPMPDASVTDLVAAIKQYYPSASSMLIFIHGFNNNFYSPFVLGATWTASLSNGSPVLVYSWPSNAQLLKYLDDETNNTWALDHFRDFLIALLNTPGAPPTINILAHSMGNRVALSALDFLARSGMTTTSHIGQVIFAAPDVDSATFFEAIPRIATVANGLTLYGSDHDEALRASREIHGHCRAGLVGCDFAVPSNQKFNAIDASVFHCDALGHGYWSSSTTIRNDIASVLKQGVNAPSQVRPGLIALPTPSEYAFTDPKPGDDTCATLPTQT